MNAAETRASSAIALWTELTVVSRSFTTAAIETFISDVSTTSTNMAAASTSGSRRLPAGSGGTASGAAPVTVVDRTPLRRHPESPGSGDAEYEQGPDTGAMDARALVVLPLRVAADVATRATLAGLDGLLASRVATEAVDRIIASALVQHAVDQVLAGDG